MRFDAARVALAIVRATSGAPLGDCAQLREAAHEPLVTTQRAVGASGCEALRQFTDAEGHRWTVVEERIPPADWTSADEDNHLAGYAVGWLLFDCAESRRRLHLFPALWQALSDHELDRLCRRALTVRRS